MKVVSTIRDLQEQLKKAGLSPVGLVPTMGALHQGHLSLVENALSSCPLVVVSIYVNPTQFNDRNDLKNYPRTLGDDLKMLAQVLREQDIVFTPDDQEMYPEPDTRVFHFGNLDRVMEALHRPGHFNGVAQVVSKLFDMVRPDIAYFGHKDFQQLAVIRSLVKQMGYRIKIVGNPIIREEDGLAMSSRNRLLEPRIRKDAGIIYKAISGAASMISNFDIPEIEESVINTIESFDGFRVEYFNIVDDTELKPIKSKSGIRKGKKYFGCIAVRAGNIRLIDNIEIPL
jgi:pantoate--beta-alanine ligase